MKCVRDVGDVETSGEPPNTGQDGRFERTPLIAQDESRSQAGLS